MGRERPSITLVNLREEVRPSITLPGDSLNKILGEVVFEISKKIIILRCTNYLVFVLQFDLGQAPEEGDPEKSVVTSRRSPEFLLRSALIILL